MENTCYVSECDHGWLDGYGWLYMEVNVRGPIALAHHTILISFFFICADCLKGFQD